MALSGTVPPLQGPEMSFELHGTEAPGAPGVCEVSPLQVPSAAGRPQWLGGMVWMDGVGVGCWSWLWADHVSKN